MTAVRETPDQKYGELCEGLHIAGYTFERACHRLEALLENDEWKKVAPGFDNVNHFLATVPLDKFRSTAEQRTRIAKRIKELQPEASNAQIGRTLGASGMQIGRDVTNVTSHQKNSNQNNEPKSPNVTNVTPPRSTRALLSQSDQNDWRTPRKYLDAARAVMGGIDLDPASSVEANETVQAQELYTDADDGLQQPWKGRVWLNPPYGGEARLFVERLIKEYQVGNVTMAMLLVNSHPTETKWFQQLFDYTVCFIAGRIDFGGPSRAVASTSTHGSAIVYLGKEVDKFRHEFSKFGAVIKKI
jgi:phage N-6-adenine-methyltransferase